MKKQNKIKMRQKEKKLYIKIKILREINNKKIKILHIKLKILEGVN